jgi:mRNA interferase RelE/StbE
MNFSSYSIRLTETAVKSLKSISLDNKSRIIEKIDELGINPLEKRNVKRLVEYDISYSMRVGDFRVLFELNNKTHIIDIIDIRH